MFAKDSARRFWKSYKRGMTEAFDMMALGLFGYDSKWGLKSYKSLVTPKSMEAKPNEAGMNAGYVTAVAVTVVPAATYVTMQRKNLISAIPIALTLMASPPIGYIAADKIMHR